MIEMTLEEDLPEEFRGGTLRIHNKGDSVQDDNSDKLSKNDNKDKANELNSANNSCHWRSFVVPLSSIPNKISETIFSAAKPATNTKPATPPPAEKETSLQPTVNVSADANTFFTFRDGVVDRAVKECTEQFLDLETEGPLVAHFLLTQINHWDTDKERLILLTGKSLVVAKYDFIALKRLAYKKIPLDDIEAIIIGDMVYPTGSLIPKINGLADGISNILENCLFKRVSNATDNQAIEHLSQTRDRNMKGVRILFGKGKRINFATKWNPFSEDLPVWTFSYHPLYFHKDCIDDNLRKLYNLDWFIETLCRTVCELQKKTNEPNSIIYHSNILLENYIGLTSVIHNRNDLGFFKVRGKFSF